MMDKISVAGLMILETDLDIFACSAAIEPALLEAGLYPPIPVSSRALVWGFRLVEKAASIGLKELNSIRIDDIPRIRLLSIALMLENRQGCYEREELEKIVLYAGGIEQIDTLTARLLFGDARKQGMEKLNSYMRLSDQGRMFAKRFGLDARTALLASGFGAGAVSEMIANSVFEKLTFSEKRLFIEMTGEVAKRDGLSDSQTEILIRSVLSKAAPVDEIEKLRNPQLHSMQNRVKEFASQYFPGSGITLSPPPRFEGDSFAISFSFTSGKNFRKKLAVLQSAGDKVDELIELL